MLSFLCGILDACSDVCTNIDDVPLEYRFDEKRASPGLLKARCMIALSHGVPESAIQFCAPECIDNLPVTNFTLSGRVY